METKIKVCLDEVIQSVYTAKCAQEMWWVLCGEKTRHQYFGTMNIYIDCFRTLIGSTFDASIIALCKALDKTKNTHNIYKLFAHLKTSSKFNAKDVKEYEIRLQVHTETIEGIKILRDKKVSHSATNLSYNVFEKASITPDQWKHLIDELIAIISDIHYALDKQVLDGLYSSEAAKELEKILQNLTDFHANKVQNFA